MSDAAVSARSSCGGIGGTSVKPKQAARSANSSGCAVSLQLAVKIDGCSPKVTSKSASPTVSLPSTATV